MCMIFVIFLLGCIVGSFLDVVACRFHTGKSLNGRSRCFSCGQTLSWFELFPLFSYLCLRGKCRACHAKIPARLFLMEFLTACLFVFVYLHVSDFFELVFGLVLMSLCIVIALYDVKHMIIPNAFVGALFALVSINIGVTIYAGDSYVEVINALVSGLGAGGFYVGLWLLSKGRWIGLGDAKLALPLGAILAPVATFSFVVLSFWVGAAISLLLLGSQIFYKRGKRHLQFLNIPLTIKSEVPFAPFILIAFWLVYYLHIDIFEMLTFTL